MSMYMDMIIVNSQNLKKTIIQKDLKKCHKYQFPLGNYTKSGIPMEQFRLVRNVPILWLGQTTQINAIVGQPPLRSIFMVEAMSRHLSLSKVHAYLPSQGFSLFVGRYNIFVWNKHTLWFLETDKNFQVKFVQFSLCCFFRHPQTSVLCSIRKALARACLQNNIFIMFPRPARSTLLNAAFILGIDFHNKNLWNLYKMYFTNCTMLLKRAQKQNNERRYNDPS